MEERPVCRSCVFGNCKAHPGDTMGYPKEEPKEEGFSTDRFEVPPGTLEVRIIVGEGGGSTAIGWVRDLSFLPDLLENVSAELRDMIVQRGRRQETARRVGEETVEIPTNAG